MDRNIVRKASAAVLLILMASVARAQTPPADLAPLSARLQNERDNAGLQRIAPFKVFDNLYYVGVGAIGTRSPVRSR